MSIFLSEGNRKLKSTTNEKFLIFNLPAEITCPYATDMCKNLCYAKKAQRLYPQVLPCRQTNLEEVKKPEFIHNMIQTIESHISKKSWQGKKVYFRWHESGDFFNADYFNQACIIARCFPDIAFCAYTKSLPIVAKFEGLIPDNLVIRFSIFPDTKWTHCKQAIELGIPTFHAVNKGYIEGENDVFCNGDCSICKMCYSNNQNTILCNMH